MALLRFYRRAQYPDRLRGYQLLVDDVGIGKIGPGEKLEVEISAGRHELMAKIDWCSSNRLILDVSEGTDCTVEVGSSLGGWRVILALLYITIWTSDYLYLRVAKQASVLG